MDENLEPPNSNPITPMFHGLVLLMVLGLVSSFHSDTWYDTISYLSYIVLGMWNSTQFYIFLSKA
jgi:hypothetical protein